MGGANAAQQYLNAGLLDEVQLHLVAVVIGEGIRPVDHVGAERIDLEPIRAVEAPGVTHLRFRVVRRSRPPA